MMAGGISHNKSCFSNKCVVVLGMVGHNGLKFLFVETITHSIRHLVALHNLSQIRTPVVIIVQCLDGISRSMAVVDDGVLNQRTPRGGVDGIHPSLSVLIPLIGFLTDVLIRLPIDKRVRLVRTNGASMSPLPIHLIEEQASLFSNNGQVNGIRAQIK